MLVGLQPELAHGHTTNGTQKLPFNRSTLPLSGMMAPALECPADRWGQRYGETIRDVGHWEHASAGRPTLEPWAASPSLYLAAPAARPDALRARIRSCRVPAGSRLVGTVRGAGTAMRIIGLDIHRVFAEAVMLDDRKIIRRLQSIRAKICSRFAKNRCHPPLAPW